MCTDDGTVYDITVGWGRGRCFGEGLGVRCGGGGSLDGMHPLEAATRECRQTGAGEARSTFLCTAAALYACVHSA